METQKHLRYLNEKQLSKLIGRSRQTLANDRWMNRGIPFSKIRRQVIYDMDDVIEFLNSRKAKTHNEFVGGEHHDCNK